jgi:hypothetical protein
VIEQPYDADEESLVPYGHVSRGLGRVSFYRGKGCQVCNLTGMKGRVAIYETMPVSQEIRDLILRNREVSEIREVAQRERAEAHDLLHAAPWLGEFKHRYRNEPRANGQRRGYRWDAIRFAHKVAAIAAANKLCSDGHLLWLDADIITHSPIDEAAIASWAPGNGVWLSWLDRNARIIGYPECSFLCFNRLYPFHRVALDWLIWFYTTGLVLTLPETHDSYVFQHMVKELDLPVRSLSGDGYNTMHPLVNSPLGQWFDHLKGNRKSAGHSYRSDLLNPRPEPYWKGRL